MLLRRFTQHIKEQNWFAVGLDVIVVIVGIFLGMQVQQWYEERSQREAEADYISRFQNELEVLQNDIQNRMVYADWVKSHMIQTIRALRSENADLDSEFIVNAYISAHGVVSPMRTNTIDEILSTGSFSKIKNHEHRQEILRFNRVSQDAEVSLSKRSDYQSAYRRAMPFETITLLRQNCAGAPLLNERGIAVFQVPPTCPPKLSIEQVKETVSSLRNADLLASLREALSNVESKIMTLQNFYEVVGDGVDKLTPQNP